MAARQADRGPWVETYTGKRFYFNRPRAEDVCIEDIAHALSNIPRFNGHTRAFYSVAQHSLAVSLAVAPPALALPALLHDAAEAYLGDIVRPVKRLFPGIKALEKAIMAVIAERFRLRWLDSENIRHADDRMLITEGIQLLGSQETGCWSEQAEPYDIELVPMKPFMAEHEFLERFIELAAKRRA